jgi:hypothetical protein
MSPRADSSVTVPFITGIVTTNTDGSYKVRYQSNDYYYWFSLDPEQQCTLNDELSAKILKKTILKPIPLSETINEGLLGYHSQITPSYFSFSMPTGIDEILSIEGIEYTYVVTPGGLNKEKSLWPSTINWDSGETFTYGEIGDGDILSPGDSKKIMISRLDSNKSMIISLEEQYIRPSGTLAKKNGKVKDRIDLANIDNLSVKFRNIPRKLKSLDSEDFEKYTYDGRGNLAKARTSVASSVGYVANNFTCWHCIDPSGQYIANIPPYYKLANEMRYRAFFGSVDGIENKNTPYLDTKEDWEWIPYEYYYDNNVSSNGSSSSNTNYASIAAFLDGQKPLASANTQPSNYFSIMNMSPPNVLIQNTSTDDSTPGFWKVEISYFIGAKLNSSEQIFYGDSMNGLLKTLYDTFVKGKGLNQYSWNIKEKLPATYKPITYIVNPEWDMEKDTGEMTTDRILDFELIKIKAAYYYVPPCTNAGIYSSPARYETVFTKTEFRRNGDYHRSYLDIRYGQRYWRPFSFDVDPVTKEPKLPNIDFAGIWHKTYDELGLLYKESQQIQSAKYLEENKPEDKINPALISYLEQKLTQVRALISNITDTPPGITRTFINSLENATEEFRTVLFDPCPPAANISPLYLKFWLFGRIMWNSTKDLGSQEQRIRQQDLYDGWPEKSIDEIIEDSN